MEIIKYGAGVFTIVDFLTEDECDQFIVFSEQQGYEEAEITTHGGSEMFKQVRNNDRLFFDDFNLARDYFERAKRYLPEEIDRWHPSGFNEKFRFYRYEAGQYFKWHKDGSFRRDVFERSMLTFFIYLNDDFQGGETAFAWDKIKPQKGTALVFPHALMHQGNSIVEGVKYVLRTDVMYARSDL